MKPAHVLRLAALDEKPALKFVGNQRGGDVGEIYPLYNLHLKGHPLDGSTLSAATIARHGFGRVKLNEVQP